MTPLVLALGLLAAACGADPAAVTAAAGQAGAPGGAGAGGTMSGSSGQAGGPGGAGAGQAGAGGGSGGSGGVGYAASCFDGHQGAGETGVDCGGDCPRCHQEQGCTQASDCWNGDCTSAGVCSAVCPAGMAAYAPAPPARPFCLDLTEVTQRDYAAFAASASPARQRPECLLYNPTLAPHDSSPPGTVDECTPNSFRPDQTPDRPVVCVDWCDADSYCRERGLHLCGRIEAPGVGLEFGNDQTVTSDQWYFACTEGHADQEYVYGDLYDPTACNGRDVYTSSPHSVDVGTFPGCRSGAGRPLDLNGNAAEFVNEWITDGTSGSIPYAKINGGSFSADEKDLDCASLRGISVDEGAANVGFRCCGS